MKAGIAYVGEYGAKHVVGLDLLQFRIDEPGTADTCLAVRPGDFTLNPASLNQDCVLSPGAGGFQGLFLPAL
ncbi:MAG: hypothetical protein ACE5ID_01075, partial [Acidobacteriota bacterium]